MESFTVHRRPVRAELAAQGRVQRPARRTGAALHPATPPRSATWSQAIRRPAHRPVIDLRPARYSHEC